LVFAFGQRRLFVRSFYPSPFFSLPPTVLTRPSSFLLSSPSSPLDFTFLVLLPPSRLAHAGLDLFLFLSIHISTFPFPVFLFLLPLLL
jgi:hypothetical protein